MKKLFEMKGQCVGRHAQTLRKSTGCQSRFSRHYQGTKDFQTRGLGKGREGFHNSY